MSAIYVALQLGARIGCNVVEICRSLHSTAHLLSIAATNMVCTTDQGIIHVRIVPEKSWPAAVSGAAAVGKEECEGEVLVVMGVAGDEVPEAEVVGEEVTAETAGLAADA